MSLQDCLPPDLQGPRTVFTRIAEGRSGAAVYRVESGDRVLVLKIANAGEPLADFRRKLQIQEAAANAGLAPDIVHADEARRAVLSAFVVDRSFAMLYGDPRTRERAVDLLGAILGRVHALPAPPGARAADPKGFLASTWSELASGFDVPVFVRDAVKRALAADVPANERAPVLSHNDVNPTNLVFDGERLLLLDWDTAAPNSPLYDLAAASVFLRMDGATCQRLLAAHDGSGISEVPREFAYFRRLAAVLCGAMFLLLARRGGHPGADEETLDSTWSLGKFYEQLRAGASDPGTADGQWRFGLALVKESVTL